MGIEYVRNGERSSFSIGLAFGCHLGLIKRERERDYKCIQKHSRGLNRVPARTHIFACLNQLS